MSADVESRIRTNLAAVQERIAAAARRSGRPHGSVRMVAVTKYAGLRAARALLAAGCTDLGESRPQELWRKAAAFHGSAAAPFWHLIGPLQRNKVRRTVPELALLHSLDRPQLAASVAEAAGARGRPLDVLLEVNISGDAAKHGAAPNDLPALLEASQQQASLRVLGLMTMAGLSGGEAAARRDFAALRALRDRLEQQAGPRLPLDELSMGMSGDFEIAIEEGATIVRIGSALFEGLDAAALRE